MTLRRAETIRKLEDHVEDLSTKFESKNATVDANDLPY